MILQFCIPISSTWEFQLLLPAFGKDKCWGFFKFTHSNKCVVIPHSGLNLNFPNGFPCSSVRKESACNAGDQGLIPGSGRSHGRKWQPTPVLLPGEFHTQRSLAGYSPWGLKSRTQLSDWTTTMVLSIPSTCLQYLSEGSLQPFLPLSK